MPSAVREGLAEGMAETRKYLLSHHEPEQHYRCYAIPIGGRRVRVCARCLGIYPGIVGGAAVAYILGFGQVPVLAVIAVLPAFALADWARTAFTRSTGSNPVRTASGALLGFAYGAGVAELLASFDPRLIAIAAVYGGLAAGLLVLENRHQTS